MTEEVNSVFRTKYNIKGFPTLKIFRNGNEESPIDFKGPRDSAGIVKYLKELGSKEL